MNKIIASAPRLLSFDALKFFAIFLVLWGHAIQYFFDGVYYDNALYRIIYSVHMPLFMTISGFFACSLSKVTAKEGLSKKIRQLLLPAIFFTTIICVSDICVGGGNLNFFIGRYLFSFWFLKSLFICCCMFIIVTRFDGRNRVLAYVMTLIASQFSSIFQINLMYPCFLYGVAINQNYSWIKNNALRLSVICGSIYIIMLTIWDASFWDIPVNKYLISLDSFTPIYAYRLSYRIILGFIGTMFFISLFEYIFSKITANNVTKIMGEVGKQTLGIYCIQVLILEMLLPRLFKTRFPESYTFDMIMAPLLSIVVMVICLIIISFLKKDRHIACVSLGIKPKC